MGLKQPKSLIPIKNNKTFLDVVVQQVKRLSDVAGCHIPLVLMNSPNTERETKVALEKKTGIKVFHFNQSYFPRLHRGSFQPVTPSDLPHDQLYYPPGHGNVFQSLYQCNLLNILLEQGIEVLFISNIDNLGATVDLTLLATFIRSKAEVCVEVTKRLAADKKGGTFVKIDKLLSDDSGNLRDLEIAQVPTEHVQDFQDILQFPTFNTGNMWVKVRFLLELFRNGPPKLDVIQNFKTISGIPIVQLETAAGSIVKCTKNVEIINVPRSRFLPVKTCADLALLQSNVFQLNESTGEFHLNPLRSIPFLPKLSFDSHFSTFDEFQMRIPQIPDMLELEELQITGNVSFSNGVILKGKVCIETEPGNMLQIPTNALLHNVKMIGTIQIIPL